MAVKRLIKGFRLSYLASGGLGTHRHVTDGLVVFAHRDNEGFHPVVVPVLAAVFYQPPPGAPGLDCLPEFLEGHGGHVRVADDVVVFVQQLFPAEAGNVHKGVVDEGDEAFEIRPGNDVTALGKRPLNLTNR